MALCIFFPFLWQHCRLYMYVYCIARWLFHRDRHSPRVIARNVRQQQDQSNAGLVLRTIDEIITDPMAESFRKSP